ncbi:MAG: hypothetical protein M3Y81_27450 [Chloroflexota bacterium]|nr:hypothetical protein [Chloroflexota bacterium]
MVPTLLPPVILAHPMFTEGYEWSYLESHVEDETWTVPKLLNEVYTLLGDLYDEPENPDFFSGCWDLCWEN